MNNSKGSKSKINNHITICSAGSVPSKPAVSLDTNLHYVVDPDDAVFRKLTTGQNGGLTVSELGKGMKKAGIPVSNTEVIKFFNSIDADGDGVISYNEFQKFCETRQAELRRIFDLIDKNSDGKLNSEEIRFCIRALGLEVSRRQLKAVMDQLVTEEEDVEETKKEQTEGHITFEKFRKALLLLPTVNPDAIFEAYETIDDATGEYTVPRNAKIFVGQSLLHAIVVQLYAGGIAGCISRTVTAPLERFKVMIQARQPGTLGADIRTLARDIYREGGIFAFYRGNGANCLKIAPETAFKFLFFENGKQLVARDPGNVTILEKFICGGVAGSLAQILIYPLEVLKTRMSVSPIGHYKGFYDCLSQIYMNRGMKGLYKGCGASTMGIIPYAGVDLMVNSVIRETASEYYAARGQEPGLAVLLGSGMYSSTCAMVCTYPLNLIRTRLQASGMQGAPVYEGALDVFQKTVTGDGFFGLYRGFGANLMKVLPSTSISYAVYDVLRNGYGPDRRSN